MLSWVCLSSAASWLSAGPSLPAWAMPSNSLRKRYPHCQGPYEKRRWVHIYKLGCWLKFLNVACNPWCARVMAFFFYFALFPGNVIKSPSSCLCFGLFGYCPKIYCSGLSLSFFKDILLCSIAQGGKPEFFSYSPRDKEEIQLKYSGRDSFIYWQFQNNKITKNNMPISNSYRKFIHYINYKKGIQLSMQGGDWPHMTNCLLGIGQGATSGDNWQIWAGEDFSGSWSHFQICLWEDQWWRRHPCLWMVWSCAWGGGRKTKLFLSEWCFSES